MAALNAEERAESQAAFEQYVQPADDDPPDQTLAIWKRTTPLEVVRRAFELIRPSLSGARVRDDFNEYLEMQEEDVRHWYNEPSTQNHPLADGDMISQGRGTQEDQNKLDRAIYDIVVRPSKLKKQARDLASGEVAGILRHRDKTRGLVEEGSALDRAMASGILPSQVGQFLTDDKNIHKGSKGEVKQSIRNLGDKVREGPGGRRTRRRRARTTRVLGTRKSRGRYK